MLQEAYDHTDNWFATPRYFNHLEQTGDYDAAQYQVNTAVYPLKGLQPYNNCGYNKSCQGDPINDWKAGDPDPPWEPICGGQGFSGKQGKEGSPCPRYSDWGAGSTDVGSAQKERDACAALSKEFQAVKKDAASIAALQAKYPQQPYLAGYDPNPGYGGQTPGAVEPGAAGTGGGGGNTGSTGVTPTTPDPSKPNNGFSCVTPNQVGADVCGNGGCKSLVQYCEAIQRNGQKDPCCANGGNGRPPDEKPPAGGGYGCVSPGMAGSDVCGNGGCKSLEEYCGHVRQNGASDPCCT